MGEIQPGIWQLGQDYFAYTLKKEFFFTYYAFKRWEEIVSQKNIAEKFKIGNLIGVERKQK